MHLSEIVATVEFGWYISLWKVLPPLIILLIWAKLLTWADKDAVDAHLPRIPLNAGFLGGLIAGYILFLMVPTFLAAFGALLVVLLIEVAAYLILRNQKVGLKDLKKQFSNWIKGLTSREKTIKIEAGLVTLFDKKGAPVQPPESDSPELAGYTALQGLLTDPLRRSADRVEMRPTEAKAASVKYWVDGVSIDGVSIPKEDASAGTTMLKELAALDVSDRRKPQTGTIKTTFLGKKHDLQVQTAGSVAGESVTIEVDKKKRYDLTIDQLGFTSDQLGVVEETIADGKGIVLVVAPEGHGLTSLTYAILRRHDAFLSHIQTIERDPQVDLEGITQNKLATGAAAGEEAKQVEWVCSQEPDVLLVDKVEEAKSAAALIKFAGNGRRVYVGMRAGSTFEALQAWRTIVGNDKLAMKQLKLAIAGRLVRKLCAACKMDYSPDPETLRRLNMPAERIGKLFTARTQPLRDARGHEMVCEFCLDLRFKGRLGVYEVFTIDDEVKQVIEAGASVNQLKMIFKKQRQKYLTEHAMSRALAGETSLQEVVRIFRTNESSSSSSAKKKTATVRSARQEVPPTDA